MSRLPTIHHNTSKTRYRIIVLDISIYNQLIQEALDEYLDRNTTSPTEGSISVTMPEKVRDKLHNLQEHGYGSIDQLVCDAINRYSIIKLNEEKEYQFLSNEVNTVANRRKIVFSDYGGD